MATAEQLKALIQCHAAGDDTRFYTVALQVAAQEARTGHTKLAQELRDLIDQARVKAKGEPAAPRLKPVPLAQPRGELADLLSVAYPKARLSDMALADAPRTRIERVLHEQQQQERLREHGFHPLRKLLLVGPPGTGKTMTASVIAGELSLPLFSIQLHGLITKFMGETAAKLRIVFDAIQRTRGVFLFDEFDALGSERGARNDVGEIRRVLNSFLQFMEQDESDSLIVAATNHPQMLDRALFRRFDARITYEMPTSSIAETVMRRRLAALDTTAVAWSDATSSADGLSHAEIARACEEAAKDSILSGTAAVTTAMLVSALDERRTSPQ